MGIVRIISDSGETFRSRREAGQALAGQLRMERGCRPVVLGIPRGGVIVAAEIARILGADLDILLSRKLGAPMNPELAIGAVSEEGKIFLNDEVVRSLSVKEEYIEQEQRCQMREIKRRRDVYRAILPKIPLQGRCVIMTDDGVATGATMQAALWAAHQERPARLIAALPVGPPEVIKGLSLEADEVLCLEAPEFFAAVGQFYSQFQQVEDQELLELLTQERLHRQK